MGWTSLRDNRTLPVICALGSNSSQSVGNATITILPMTRFYVSDPLFYITEEGAVRITKPGTYAFDAGVYYSGSVGGSHGLELAYTETLGATTGLTRLYAAMYQNKGGGSMAHALPMKVVKISNPCDMYLRAWVNADSGVCNLTSTGTFLNIIKLSN